MSKAKSAKTVHVGIDLGTSRSAISTSIGKKVMAESYVGWPLDMVARKILKKDLLVGAEAVNSRTMVDLRRPLEHGLLREASDRDLEAVRHLVKHLIDESGVSDESTKGADVHAVVGVPAQTLIVNKEHVRNALDGLVDKLILVSEPFAVAYGLEALLHTLVIDIGAGTTDFCVMMGRYPTEDDQRTLQHAGDSVDEQIMRLVRDHHPEAQFTIHMVREWKEKFAFVGSRKSPAIATVSVDGTPTDIDITEEIRVACTSLVAPLSETMHDLISQVEPEFQEAVRNNVILAGGCSAIVGLAKALEETMSDIGGGSIRIVKEPVFAGADGGLALAKDAPETDWEKLAP